MSSQENDKIKVKVSVNTSLSDAWEKWTRPEHVVKWNFASDDWHSPRAEADLIPGGRFKYRMEAKDGSAGFDFSGTFTEIVEKEKMCYTLDDGRKVSILFSGDESECFIIEEFDPENQHTYELQKQGWQMIMDNFKKYAEK